MPRPGTTARTQAEIERTIITVLLNDDHAIVPVMGALDGPEMFATPEYSRVYAAVLALLRENIVPNVYTVADRTGLALEALQEIARGYTTKASREVLYLCDIVAREYRKRSVQQALAEAQDMLAANPDDLDGYATHVMQMISTASDRKTLRDPAIAAVTERLDQDIADAQDGMAGYETGLPWLDDKTGGLQKAHVWVLAAPYKGRKCVTGDTLILTREGYRRIADVCADIPVGFTEKSLEVWGLGGWHVTSHVYRSSAGPTIRLRTRKGYTLEATPHHPILVASEQGVSWREIGELTPGTPVAICRQPAEQTTSALPPAPPIVLACRLCGRQDPRGSKRGLCINCYARLRKRGTLNVFPRTCTQLTWHRPGSAVRFPTEMTPDLARFFGYLVAEGTLTQKSEVGFSNTTPEIVADFFRLCRELFGIKPRQYGINHHVSNRWLRDWLAACGLHYVTAERKTIPWVILQSNRACQAAFLNAYFSGDGWVRRGNGLGRSVMVASASETLIAQIQVLLLGFGIVSARSRVRNKKYDRCYHTLSISGSNAVKYASHIGFSALHKAERLAERVNGLLITRSRHTCDPIPGMRNVLRQLWEATPTAIRPGVMPLFDGRRAGDARNVEITHERARKIVEALRSHVPAETPSPLHRAVEDNFFFDEVTSLEPGYAETYDLCVPDTHSFMSNGFISHNTSLARNLILPALRQGAGVDWFALEGSQTASAAALQAMLATDRLRQWGQMAEAGLSETYVMRGMRTPVQQEALAEARRELNGFNLRIYDGRDRISSAERIATLVKRDQLVANLRIFVVDFLQRLGTGKLFDRMEAATNVLQTLIQESGVTGILITQLNESAIWTLRDDGDESYSPGVKGGGDVPAAADYLITTRYRSDAPEMLGVNLKLARFAQPGKCNYGINPSSGLILQQLGQGD